MQASPEHDNAHKAAEGNTAQPADITDAKLKEYLERFKVGYKFYAHRAVFTVKESGFLRSQIKGVHTKNLFLEDGTGRFYLVCMDADRRLDIKALRRYLKTDRLQFASTASMKAELGLIPGSVTIFGMIGAKNTRLILDAGLWRADAVSFHANINTETLELTHEDLERFYESLEAEKEVLEL